MNSHLRHPLVLKTLAVLGYASCIFQWMLATVPYLPSLLKSDVFHTDVTSDIPRVMPQPSPIATPSLLPDWLIVALAVIIAVAMVVFAVISIASLPKMIGTTGQKVTHRAAEHITPIIVHHQKVSPKKRRMLTARVVFDLKLAATTIPVIVVLVGPRTNALIPHDALLLLSALAAGWTLLLFCSQVIVARALRIDLSRLW